MAKMSLEMDKKISVTTSPIMVLVLLFLKKSTTYDVRLFENIYIVACTLHRLYTTYQVFWFPGLPPPSRCYASRIKLHLNIKFRILSLCEMECTGHMAWICATHVLFYECIQYILKSPWKCYCYLLLKHWYCTNFK